MATSVSDANVTPTAYRQSFALPSNRIGSFAKWLVILAGFALLQMLLFCPSCLFEGSERAFYNFMYSYSLFTFLWLGNGFISKKLNRVGNWVEQPGRRFVYSLFANVTYSALAIIFINWFFLVVVSKHPIEQLTTESVRWSMFFQILGTFFITMTVHAIAFLRGWRQSEINAERLQKEHALSKYEALKNQVNPHFLFNSLNALTSLVHPDPDLAVKFIKQLSEVYRYVLDSQHKEVVSLEEELNFTQRYVFLQQIRHGESLQVQLPSRLDQDWHLPPLALQMLFENAVKHNRLLPQEPLTITAAVEGEYLVVRNNLQAKSQSEPPSGLGLPNIKARYAMLTNKKMEAYATETEFIVKLPLLTFQD